MEQGYRDCKIPYDVICSRRPSWGFAYEAPFISEEMDFLKCIHPRGLLSPGTVGNIDEILCCLASTIVERLTHDMER